MQKIVFISHATEDRSFAENACAALEGEGIPCWIAPRDLRPGDEYAAAIVDAIDATSIFLLVVTPASVASPQVLREVERAASRGKTFVSIKLHEVSLTKALEYYLSAYHWLDAVRRPPREAIALAIHAIREKVFGKPDSALPGASTTPQQSNAPVQLHSGTPFQPTEDLSEDEFGGGAVEGKAAYLVLGMLTIWVSVVMNFSQLLLRHLATRKELFSRLLPAPITFSSNVDAVPYLLKTGFSVDKIFPRAAFVCFCTVLAIVVLRLGQLTFQTYNGIIAAADLFNWPDFYFLALCGLIFWIGMVCFVVWVFKALQQHEWAELQLVKALQNPGRYGLARPPQSFIKRWGVLQSQVILFLILGMPVALSPAIGLYYIHGVMHESTSMLRWYSLTIIGWLLGVYAIGALYHVWGLRTIYRLYEGHLLTERVCRPEITYLNRT